MVLSHSNTLCWKNSSVFRRITIHLGWVITRAYSLSPDLNVQQIKNIFAKWTRRNLFVYSTATMTEVASTYFFLCSSFHVSGEYYYHKSYFMGVVYIVELRLGTKSLGVRPIQQGTRFCLWFWYMLYAGNTVSWPSAVKLLADGDAWHEAPLLRENCS
jgi:hypothetical protein